MENREEKPAGAQRAAWTGKLKKEPSLSRKIPPQSEPTRCHSAVTAEGTGLPLEDVESSRPALRRGSRCREDAPGRGSTGEKHLSSRAELTAPSLSRLSLGRVFSSGSWHLPGRGPLLSPEVTLPPCASLSGEFLVLTGHLVSTGWLFFLLMLSICRPLSPSLPPSLGHQ